ncbi:MAG: hypothetical protein GX221_04650 [Candidatus Riflebacteria bacterium]|nr:hypothetical protein [Candidatus Riflebacteria bacterium]
MQQLKIFFQKGGRYLLAFVLLFGFLLAFWRSHLRIVSESANKYFETVADYTPLLQAAQKEGYSEATLIAALKNAGVTSVLLREDTIASLENMGKLRLFKVADLKALPYIGSRKEINLPSGWNSGICIYSKDHALLRRIEKRLLILKDRFALKTARTDTDTLFVNRFDKLFMEDIGLGFSARLFKELENAGLGVYLELFGYNEMTKEEVAASLEAIPDSVQIRGFFAQEKEIFAHDGALDELKERIAKNRWIICTLEFQTYRGMQRYYKELGASAYFRKAHSIKPAEMRLVYTPKRALERMVRAAKERSLRILLLRSFETENVFNAKDMTAVNLDWFKSVSDACRAWGLEPLPYGEPLEAYSRLSIKTISEPSGWQLYFIALALFSSCFVVAFMLFGALPDLWVMIAFLLFVALLQAFMPPAFLISSASLTGAILYAVAAFLSIFKVFGINRLSNGLLKAAAASVVMAGIALFGGILIAGISSSAFYLNGFIQFRGVKAALLFPVFFAFLYSLIKYGKGFGRFVRGPVTFQTLFLVFIMLLFLVVYVGRSGNFNFLNSSALEDSFRVFLEDTLVARPRTKEFLIGYPAVFLFLFFALRKIDILLPLLAVLMQMAAVSLVNTMCHFHSPLLLSFLRVFNGLWTGISVGILVFISACILSFLAGLVGKKEKAVFLLGYFGFGNYGDELLRTTFIKKFQSRMPDYTIYVLTASKEESNEPGVIFLRRRSFVLPKLVSCQALIVPGGGVFQSSTSLRSLAYYLFFLSMARIAGVKVFLPAQGLGPFKNGIAGALLKSALEAELVDAEYLSLRDLASKKQLPEILANRNLEVVTDLFFWGADVSETQIKPPGNLLKTYVVLRASVPGVLKMAKEILALGETFENIKIIPLVFSDPEDTKLWKEAGFKGELISIYDSPLMFEEADIIISMRLHGAIMATAACIPWIGINYDPKVKGFADSVSWSEFVKTPEEFDSRWLVEQLNLLAIDRTYYSAKLYEESMRLKKIAERDFEAFIGSFERLCENATQKELENA